MHQPVISALAILLAFAARPAAAGDLPPADQKLLHDYNLTLPKVKALSDTTIYFAQHPDIGEELNDLSGDVTSLAALKAGYAAHPKLVDVFAKHGLTVDDAVLMPYVLSAAAVALQSPEAAKEMSAQVSPAQIAFVKAHKDEIDALDTDAR